MPDSHILTGKVSNDPAVLLGGGAAIFITNVIVFGIWYWELGRGGPIAHCEMKRIYPDFMFAQMANPEVAPKGLGSPVRRLPVRQREP